MSSSHEHLPHRVAEAVERNRRELDEIFGSFDVNALAQRKPRSDTKRRGTPKKSRLSDCELTRLRETIRCDLPGFKDALLQRASTEPESTGGGTPERTSSAPLCTPSPSRGTMVNMTPCTSRTTQTEPKRCSTIGRSGTKTTPSKLRVGDKTLLVGQTPAAERRKQFNELAARHSMDEHEFAVHLGTMNIDDRNEMLREFYIARHPVVAGVHAQIFGPLPNRRTPVSAPATSLQDHRPIITPPNAVHGNNEHDGRRRARKRLFIAETQTNNENEQSLTEMRSDEPDKNNTAGAEENDVQNSEREPDEPVAEVGSELGCDGDDSEHGDGDGDTGQDDDVTVSGTERPDKPANDRFNALFGSLF